MEELLDHSTIQTIPKDTEILREGQYVKVIPIVLDGLIKVFSRHEEKELLIYYIKPSDSCIMSFTSSLKSVPSPVFAITEEETTVLLLPASKVERWTKDYHDFNGLFYQQFNLRYSELLNTINHLLFDKMDKRLMDYLNEKRELTGKSLLKISHRVIANELGTAREVISRVAKKLESEGLIKQHHSGIEIL
jgi:CRP/FNR family transcriptional regulator